MLHIHMIGKSFIYAPFFCENFNRDLKSITQTHFIQNSIFVLRLSPICVGSGSGLSAGMCCIVAVLWCPVAPAPATLPQLFINIRKCWRWSVVPAAAGPSHGPV